MAKILVVGGAGYIGSHVVKYLLEKGYEVFVLDNLSHGHKIFVDERAVFFQGDLLDELFLKNLFENNSFDLVMHFAAHSLVGESVREPLKYYKNNVKGTINLLNVMMKNGVDKFILSSTAAVYGEPTEIPITEDCLTKPTNPYGNSKLMIERILDDLDSAGKLTFVALRYFNAAGAAYGLGEWHDPETHLIPLILQTALGERDSITIFGENYDTIDGTCIRDYIHILDLASAHELAIIHLLKKGISKKFNLGTSKGNSVKEIIEVCKKVTKKNFKVIKGKRREGDPSILVASYKTINKEWGWEPKETILSIVESAWEWHKKLNKIKFKLK